MLFLTLGIQRRFDFWTQSLYRCMTQMNVIDRIDVGHAVFSFKGANASSVVT